MHLSACLIRHQDKVTNTPRAMIPSTRCLEMIGHSASGVLGAGSQRRYPWTPYIDMAQSRCRDPTAHGS